MKKSQSKINSKSSKITKGKRLKPTDEKIRSRAYEIYEHRGFQHGRDLEDWFQAEDEFEKF